MHPDRDTLSNVPRSGYITTRDQNMVESGVTDGGKNTASFLFREWTQQYADSGKKPGSCMEARLKGPHTQNGHVTKDSCLQNKTSAAPS